MSAFNDGRQRCAPRELDRPHAVRRYSYEPSQSFRVILRIVLSETNRLSETSRLSTFNIGDARMQAGAVIARAIQRKLAEPGVATDRSNAVIAVG